MSEKLTMNEVLESVNEKHGGGWRIPEGYKEPSNLSEYTLVTLEKKILNYLVSVQFNGKGDIFLSNQVSFSISKGVGDTSRLNASKEIEEILTSEMRLLGEENKKQALKIQDLTSKVGILEFELANMKSSEKVLDFAQDTILKAIKKG